jgi:hypothetical protein
MFRRYKRSLGRWVIVSAALVAFSRERSALAGVPLEPVALSYQAPEACPSFEQFLMEVQRWTPRLRLARKNEVARRFEARIAESGVEGQLVLEGGGGGERAVKGANCQAVAELLALAVALAADPDAKPDETTPSVGAFEPLPGAEPLASKPMVSPAAAGASSSGSPSPASPASPASLPTAASSPAPPSRSRGFKWSLAGTGFATGTSTPVVTWGGGGRAELGLSTLPWAPHVRLGANYAKKTVEVPPGRVVFTTEFISLEVCAGKLRQRAFLFLPCLRAQGGSRRAAGEDLLGKRSELRAFFDLGLAGHARFYFAGPAFVELGAALLFPTVRDKVVISPEHRVYSVPALGLLGEGTLGVEFGDQTSR